MLENTLLLLTLTLNGFLFTIWSTRGWDNKLIKFLLFIVTIMSVIVSLNKFGVL